MSCPHHGLKLHDTDCSVEFVEIQPFNPFPMIALSSNHTASMILVAAKRPDERKYLSGSSSTADTVESP